MIVKGSITTATKKIPSFPSFSQGGGGPVHCKTGFSSNLHRALATNETFQQCASSGYKIPARSVFVTIITATAMQICVFILYKGLKTELVKLKPERSNLLATPSGREK